MNYQETLAYLYARLPMFQRIGAAAFKKDLSNTIQLCDFLGQPQKKFKSIHVAGTNGKGSTSHKMAAVLQAQGYKVGLYTSPHLKSFTERIRINGQEISEQEVVEFVQQIRPLIENIQPSFFELSVAMAFDHFARHKVDVAVIEVGMGGRLDSTNIILPEISLITNISYDHQAFLGNTLPEIAAEKAGIIKKEVPVVVSEFQRSHAAVFEKKASEMKSPLVWASKHFSLRREKGSSFFETLKQEKPYLSRLSLDMAGSLQKKNTLGAIAVLDQLRMKGWNIDDEAIRTGLAQVQQLTGLKGRWQLLQKNPLVICDTGHNEAAWKYNLQRIKKLRFKDLRMVLGFVADKDLKKVMALLPAEAIYYFCKADIPRAMEAEEISEIAKPFGLKGIGYSSVEEALDAARKAADKKDLIYVGGSTFVVAEIPEL